MKTRFVITICLTAIIFAIVNFAVVVGAYTFVLNRISFYNYSQSSKKTASIISSKIRESLIYKDQRNIYDWLSELFVFNETLRNVTITTYANKVFAQHSNPHFKDGKNNKGWLKWFVGSVDIHVKNIVYYDKLQQEPMANINYNFEYIPSFTSSKLIKQVFVLYVVYSFLIIVLFNYLSISKLAKPLRSLFDIVMSIVEEKPTSEKIYKKLSYLLPIGENIKLFKQQYDMMKSELERQSVLAAMGQISSQVAHDMRSPVSVLQGFLEGENSPEMRYAAVRSVNKLNLMANELLDYSKASKIEPTEVSLKELVNAAVISEVKATAGKKGVKLICDVNDGIVANIDPYRISRVLINLITNAIQAVDGEKGEVKISVKSEGNSLKIRISDNGKGIAKSDVDKIFESFFTKGKFGGTGLGLSYCKNVIDAHGGMIEVESEVGKGTEFTINIPNCISSPHAKPSIQSSAFSVQPTKDEPRSDEDILVVDDDMDMVLLWNSKIQKKYGKSPITSGSPEELMKTKIDYSMISKAIVDYQYDGSKLTGLDVVRFLKKKGVKVIHLCTGMYHDKELQSQAKELGVVSIIPKPIAADVDV